MELHFKDFDECYEKVNKAIACGKIKTQVDTAAAYILEPLIIRCDTMDLKNITLHKCGSKKYKMDRLKRCYYDKESMDIFLDNCVKENKDQWYVFPSRKRDKGKEKLNCLISLLYVKKRDELIIHWRNTEFGSKFGADLIMLNEILEFLNCKVILLIETGYQHVQIVKGIFELNGWEWKKNETNEQYNQYVDKWADMYFCENFKFYKKWYMIFTVQREVARKRGYQVDEKFKGKELE